MPSKLNSEFNYRYQVMGDTPWEKIKILKGFLEGRVRAAALEQVGHLKFQAKQARVEHLKSSGAPLHEIMEAQAELLELESHMVVHDEAYELNRQEIDILNRLLAECYAIAEPTRLPGYSDEQMFEHNAALEFSINTIRKMQAEIIATGRPQPVTVMQAMSNPLTLNMAEKANLIPQGSAEFLNSNRPVLTDNSILELEPGEVKRIE